jgi:putative flavoprotein involved in K+ transport
MSRCLSESSIDHVVLERGSVANSWEHERWEGLRLLTPNWQSRLPGYAYEGEEADGFMSMPEVISFIQSYAERIAAPVQGQTAVLSVSRVDKGYALETSQGPWLCEALVIATGACNLPRLPGFVDALPKSLLSLTPMNYQRPSDLPEGGVLVVGASASGLQLADDIHRSGRAVTLAVGQHLRMPRVYRGKDIQWWLDAAGFLDERFDEVNDIRRARHLPSPQLVGSSDRMMLDLNALSQSGVRLVGRLAGISEGRAQFSGSLRNTCKLADLKMNRLLDRLDQWAKAREGGEEVSAAERFEPTRVETDPALSLDLRGGEIRTVLWATGYRPDYSWLQVPVLDRKGMIRHRGGVVDSPGLYLMGANFLRRRKSSFIHGAGDDASDLSAHLKNYLDTMHASPRG